MPYFAKYEKWVIVTYVQRETMPDDWDDWKKTTQQEIKDHEIMRDLRENPLLTVMIPESVMIQPQNETEQQAQQLAIVLTVMYWYIKTDTDWGFFRLSNIRKNSEWAQKYLEDDTDVINLIVAVWGKVTQKKDGRVIGVADTQKYYVPIQKKYDTIEINLTEWDQVFDTQQEAEDAWYIKWK